MKDRSQRFGGLFPLLPSVGITVLYFETGQGKDLDNLIRTILPILLDELQPPILDRLHLDPDPELDQITNKSWTSAGNDVRFVEAIALDKVPSDIDPGTAFRSLSSGWRQQRWWEGASRYVDDFVSDQ